MVDNYILNDEQEKQCYTQLLNNEFGRSNSKLLGEHFYLTEEDFYPPVDNRVWKSYVEDIDGGDNFADYCEYIFNIYEEEGYYD